MKKYIYPLALTATALFATACSDKEIVDDIQNIPDSQKEKISFSLSDGTGTRAGFMEGSTRILMRIESEDRHSGTPGASKYTRALATAAKDEMSHDTADDLAKAYSTVSTSDDPRYWDDAYGRFGQLSVYAIAIANKNDASLIPLSMMYDASGNKSVDANTSWGSSANSSDHIADNTIEFTVEKNAPTCEKMEKQDLVYSNNIKTDGSDGVYRYNFTTKEYPAATGQTTHTAGRMIFAQEGVSASSEPTSATGKFDKGHLVFNHALSRMTVVVVEGAGFNTSSTEDFKFKSSTNIKLLDMNTTGTLDVETGIWTPGTPTAIDKMAPISYDTSNKMIDATPTTAAGTYMAQMLPGYTFTAGSNTNVMEFEIDNNTYYVTQDMLFDALCETETNKTANYGYDATNKFTMMQGKNYKFTITVKKTGISAITATLSQWVDVEGHFEMDNSHITVSTKKLEGSDNTPCDDFNLYRWAEVLNEIHTDDSYTAITYSGNYKADDAATKQETSSGSHIWNTNWFYENNKTAYHFRTLNPLAADGSGTVGSNSNITNTGSDPVVSSFKMVSGAVSRDYHWGAPMKTDADLAYSADNGYTASLHQGIIAPKNSQSNTINITELHMMSNIYVTLKTASSGSNKVNLDGATVTLTQISTEASVDMGTGKITPELQSDWTAAAAKLQATTPTTYWASGHDTNKDQTAEFSCAVVPQILVRGTGSTHTDTDYVGITIRTSDGNEYYVIKELSDITATSVSGGHNVEENQKIQSWYPGHKYYYTFTITKKGIENITCTLFDWITVSGNDTPIDLES